MEALTRFPDWQARLSEYLISEMTRGFVYGESDCALFAAGAVLVMTGFDPAAKWRGKYSTLKAGLQLIKSVGHKDHIAATAAVLVEIPTGSARVGDIAVVNGVGALALGVVTESGVAVRPPLRGLGLVQRSEMRGAFKCG
ncbi:MAG TPA: hypothetical protein ENK28_04640 [Aliiroseovarius sp.]|nr:hypothetical protein [Aliiroseovarius sp.]